MENYLQSSLTNSYVLAVEDSPLQARKLELFFKSHDINYRLFNNAEAAFEAAQRQHPKIIISDIIMPGMDGYEFCIKIKNTPELRNVPVILLTSLQDPQDIIKGLQAGADNFITKPYLEEYLLSRIQYLIINSEIRRTGLSEMVIELIFRGQKYHINSDKKQILDLLLSVYEAAIQRNDELTATKAKLEIANENLMSANKDLEAFTRMVSHDLRSPLNGIIGFSDLLLSEPSYELNPETRNIVEMILQSSSSMAQLINDLLAFARSGIVSLAKEKVNLSDIANETIRQIRLRNPDLKLNINVEAGLVAYADPAMMRIVLDNLLNNAVKYSSKVEHPEVVFGQEKFYGNLVYFIKDNGAGFDSSKAEQLFQPFQRFHNSKEFKGTGVGLSTVKKIIDKHGGTIWADSEVNKGCTFYFSIPEDTQSIEQMGNLQE